MIRLELTRARGLATIPAMTGASRTVRWARALPLAALAASAIGGCVNVTAPDKPIVIELNVNIRQEVIYRLAADAENTVDQNKDIF
jgi:hypothetical protein